MRLAVIGSVLAASIAAPGPAVSAPPKLTSTLDGKKVLPLVSHWIAKPSVPAAKVTRVDFLIDGKVRGIERKAPYNYGSDDFHGHLGSLVTSWLTPGRHRFTARAHLKNGQTLSDTVIARVLPAPSPPANLAGKWKRRVTNADIRRADPKSVGDLPAGAWQLVFDRVGVWDLDPKGSGVVEHVVIHPNTIRIDAPVWMTSYVDGGRGRPSVNRYGHKDIGAFFCREDGPPGTYRWAVTGKHLTLTAIHEPCGARRAVWAGTWTRST